MMNNDIYGVLTIGGHVDVSKNEKAAKAFATKHGYKTVTIRYNCGYIASEFAKKINGRWKKIKNNSFNDNI